MEPDNEDVKRQEKEIVEDLESEVEELERDFESFSDDDVAETTREKQEMVKNILEEVHGQLEFLKEVAENDTVED